MKEAQQPTYSSTCTGNQGRLYALCCTYQVLSEFGQSQPLFSPVSPPRASSLLEKLPDFAKSARWITSAGYSKVAFSRTKDPLERHVTTTCKQAPALPNQAAAPTSASPLTTQLQVGELLSISSPDTEPKARRWLPMRASAVRRSDKGAMSLGGLCGTARIFAPCPHTSLRSSSRNATVLVDVASDAAAKMYYVEQVGTLAGRS